MSRLFVKSIIKDAPRAVLGLGLGLGLGLVAEFGTCILVASSLICSPAAEEIEGNCHVPRICLYTYI
jgi:hypothetical protein